MNRGFSGRKALCTALVLMGLSAAVAAYADGGDIDQLFNQDGTVPAGSGDQGGGATGTGSATGSTATGQAAGGQTPPSAAVPDLRPDDPTRDQKIHYFGNLNIYGLLGLGYTRPVNLSYPSSGLGNEGSGSLAATLGVDIRPTPELRLSATLGYYFPKIGTQLSELIIDYSVLNSLFFRVGIFDTTWGTSQFFQFSNLPSRSLPGWGVNNEPLWQQTNIITQTVNTVLPVNGKLDIPIGLSNLTLLARFDTEDYGFPDPTAPDPRYAGYGVHYDLPTGPIEWSVGVFYQYLLNPRGSLGLKTNVLGFDVSLESTLAIPVSVSTEGITWRPTSGGGFPVGVDGRVYPTVVAGVSREWTDAHIKVYGEYAYNGEREPHLSWLNDATGPGGHNSAIVVRLGNLFGSDISLNALWQHNWSDGSGLLSPLLEFSPARLATLQLGPVMVYGPEDGEVVSNRLVPGNKRLEFLVLLRVSESYRQ